MTYDLNWDIIFIYQSFWENLCLFGKNNIYELLYCFILWTLWKRILYGFTIYSFLLKWPWNIWHFGFEGWNTLNDFRSDGDLSNYWSGWPNSRALVCRHLHSFVDGTFECGIHWVDGTHMNTVFKEWEMVFSFLFI